MQKIKTKIMSRLGAAASEYVIIALLASAFSIGTVSVFGDNIRSLLGTAENSLAGVDSTPATRTTENGSYSLKGAKKNTHDGMMDPWQSAAVARALHDSANIASSDAAFFAKGKRGSHPMDPSGRAAWPGFTTSRVSLSSPYVIHRNHHSDPPPGIPADYVLYHVTGVESWQDLAQLTLPPDSPNETVEARAKGLQLLNGHKDEPDESVWLPPVNSGLVKDLLSAGTAGTILVNGEPMVVAEPYHPVTHPHDYEDQEWNPPHVGQGNPAVKVGVIGSMNGENKVPTRSGFAYERDVTSLPEIPDEPLKPPPVIPEVLYAHANPEGWVGFMVADDRGTVNGDQPWALGQIGAYNIITQEYRAFAFGTGGGVWGGEDKPDNPTPGLVELDYHEHEHVQAIYYVGAVYLNYMGTSGIDYGPAIDWHDPHKDRDGFMLHLPRRVDRFSSGCMATPRASEAVQLLKGVGLDVQGTRFFVLAPNVPRVSE